MVVSPWLGLEGRIARTLLRTKQYAETVAAAERALEAFPTSARLHFIQGQAYLSLKRPRQAFRSFEKAKRFGKKVKGGLDKKLVDK
jgi:tetratricopeptide (TPR) repeat protein